MKRKQKIKRMKTHASKTLTIIAIILASVACLGSISLLFGGNGSSTGTEITPGGNGGTEVLPNEICVVDSNIALHQNSHGAAYVKNVVDKTYVYVTNEASGDYILLDFADVSVKDFFESNHTQLRVSFDILGLSDLALPIMEIVPLYSEGAPLLTNGNTKLSPVSTSKFSCTTSYKLSDSSLLGTFNTSGKHMFEYIYTKDAKNGSLSLTASIDGIGETFVYYFSDWDFTLNSIKIQLSNNYTEPTAVRVENLATGYVPALAAFPGEVITIPTDCTVTVLGDRTNAFYGIYNVVDATGLTLGELNADKNTAIIKNGIPGGAYAAIYLKNDYKSVNVFDYSYLTVEYDVSVPEGAAPVECMAYLLGRPGGSVKQYAASNTWFYVDGNEIYGLNTEKSHMTVPGSSMHVKYVIALGDDGYGDLQVFIDDVLYYCAENVFDSTYNCIEELRVKHFSGSGSISFTNLKVCGYN